MAYQSRHSGAQIDAAIDAINSALNKEQMWVNKEEKVTLNSWQRTGDENNKGVWVCNVPYTPFSAINKFPTVYFVDESGKIWDMSVVFNSTTTPTGISIYSNVALKGTVVICSNSGYLEQ